MIAPRRFWTQATVAPRTEGFGVLLDGQALRTPAKAELRVPGRALAEAIAAEWQAIEGEIRPAELPFTRAVNVAIDRVANAREAVIEAIAAYGSADLLCYRAERPEALRRRQDAAWDPLLDWSASTLGARLRVVDGVMPGPQPAESLAALRAAVAEQDDFQLTALHELVALCGSLVGGLAVRRGAIDAATVWDLSRIDETWQAEQWGEDADALDAASRKRADFLQAALLLELLAKR